MKVSFKKALFKTIKMMSPKWRDKLIRKSIKLPLQDNQNLKFKIVETTEELEAAFRLVYKEYVVKGYCKMNKHEMRATIYHALPTTSTLIAKDRDKVVGTLTVVRDNRLGLPSEKTFNYKHLRTRSHRLAEITSLVIDSEYRRKNGGDVFFPLLKLMYEYTTYYFGVNHLLVTIHPKDTLFYKTLLLFKKHKTSVVKDYLGAPATSLHLDLQQALHDFKRVYSDKKPQNDLYHFFVEKKLSNIIFPHRKYNTINDPLVNENYFNNVFVSKLNLLEGFNDRRKVEPILKQKDVNREHFRIEVEAPAYIIDEVNGPQAKFTIKDVSRNGFRAYTDDVFNLSSEINFRVQLAADLACNVKATVVWVSPDYGVGFEIIEADNTWYQFISHIYSDQLGEAA